MNLRYVPDQARTLYARMEKVFSIVAPNPRNKPETPSFLYILSSTESIERSALSLTFPSDDATWILVFALMTYECTQDLIG